MPATETTAAPILEPLLDVAKVPFSRAGSFACFNVLPASWNCTGVW